MHWWRDRLPLRLRDRLALLFGLSGALVAILVSGVTYGLLRNTLLDRREEDAVAAFYANRDQAGRLITDTDNLDSLRDDIAALGGSADTKRLVLFNDDWVGLDPIAFGEEAVNPELLTASLPSGSADGVVHRMRYRVGETPYIVLGAPVGVAGVTVVYFEATPLDDIASTLRTLALTLFGATALTTVLAGALGAWASRRALSPLAEVSEAARAIAAGELDARLGGGDDADLEVLVTSFNEMATALQQRIERDARFASDVSHELRSPLMTITTSVEILKAREDEMPERSRIALNLLSDDIARFRQLVEDLLEISRYGVGAVRIERDSFDVVTLIEQAARQSGFGDVPLDTGTMGTLLIEADKRRLARVVANLLENAAKYGGGATAVRLEREGPDVRIIVEDQGPGVPESERTLIFDRFARGSEGGRRGTGTGTGLGLALVAEHVRLHGGQVWVEDRENGASGAAFVVELPGVVR